MIERGEIKPPDFMKVDVEGAELLVFTGAEETVRRYRPIIVFEELKKAIATLGLEPGRVARMLAEIPGYRLFLISREAPEGHLDPLPMKRRIGAIWQRFRKSGGTRAERADDQDVICAQWAVTPAWARTGLLAGSKRCFSRRKGVSTNRKERYAAPTEPTRMAPTWYRQRAACK